MRYIMSSPFVDVSGGITYAVIDTHTWKMVTEPQPRALAEMLRTRLNGEA